jgi:hypothetical protein
MIQVVIKPSSIGGKFDWHTDAPFAAGGRSHQPLLDACRALKRMGAAPGSRVGLFREGSTVWDLRTTVRVGAELSVQDPSGSHHARFIKWRLAKTLDHWD